MDAKILQSKKMGEGDRNKQKIQIGAVIFLVLVFIYLLVSTVMGGKKRPKAQSAVPAAVATVPESSSEELFPVEKEAEEAQTANPDDWGASPFSMASSQEPQNTVVKSDLILKGIVFSSAEESYAIINEKIVKKGERVADNTVKEIFGERVVLQNDQGELVTLKR